MKNFLLALTMASAILLVAGCFSRTVVDQEPSIVDARPTPQVATPQMSPDVNFKASNAMPGQPSL
jgi:hypothetical protein